MAVDILTLAMARKFTKDTANALGAVKGAPCMIESIVDTGDANIVTFKWTGMDGAEQTTAMTIPHGMTLEEQAALEARLKGVEEIAKRAEEAAKRAEENAGDCDCTDGSIDVDHDGQGNVVFHLTGMSLVDDGKGNISIV